MNVVRAIVLHIWIVPLYGYLDLAAVQSRCIQAELLCSFPFSKWLRIMAILFVMTYILPRIFVWWRGRGLKSG
jgi:hypothetical protein